jgi:hypothetical protein
VAAGPPPPHRPSPAEPGTPPPRHPRADPRATRLGGTRRARRAPVARAGRTQPPSPSWLGCARPNELSRAHRQLDGHLQVRVDSPVGSTISAGTPTSSGISHPLRRGPSGRSRSISTGGVRCTATTFPSDVVVDRSARPSGGDDVVGAPRRRSPRARRPPASTAAGTPRPPGLPCRAGRLRERGFEIPRGFQNPPIPDDHDRLLAHLLTPPSRPRDIGSMCRMPPVDVLGPRPMPAPGRPVAGDAGGSACSQSLPPSSRPSRERHRPDDQAGGGS